MASARDIQDIMGMGGGPVQHPNKKKKKKIVETHPKLSGISREVAALMGDSVPPVQLLEVPKYKAKPSLAAKLYRPRHWEERVYTPGARNDGLALNHWRRAVPIQRQSNANGGVAMENGEKETTTPVHEFDEEFPMEKWDIHLSVPEYTEEQYEKYYKIEDWTREETDYLIRLVSDYDLRWILISDRYDPAEIQPSSGAEESTEITRSYPSRTVEQMKSRYYQIAAQDLELRTPKSAMNPTEFALFEKMRNFDAKTEAMRKNMAEKLFERTKEEAEEERTLLEELHRITKNDEEFISLRRDLYARLESAPSLRRNERGEEQNIVLSSAGLSDLLSRLFAKEKHLKRRLPAPGESNVQAQQAQPEGRVRSNTQISRRDTMETPTENKKASVSLPVPKSLSKAEEERYGVSHPTERLASGVSFRHEKINRVTTAKSQVQTQKLIAALAELQIPARLSMPTENVCKEFERLVSQLQLLLDARKTLTRVSEEVKTLEEMRRQRLGEPAPSELQNSGGAMEVDGNALATKVSTQTSTSQETTKLAGAMASGSNEDDEDEGPGPAVDEDDEDAEAEEHEVDASNIERTEVDDDEELDDTQVNETQQDLEDDNDEEEEDEEDEDEDEEEEEEEEEDDEDEGMQALRRGAVNDDEGDSEEEEEENPEPLVEEGDSDEEGNEDETEDVTMNEVELADGDPDVEDDAAAEASRPTSAGSRGHKRGASAVSDASGAGSTRSGLGRKRKR